MSLSLCDLHSYMDLCLLKKNSAKKRLLLYTAYCVLLYQPIIKEIAKNCKMILNEYCAHVDNNDKV
jgi:hypothetical protein